jgi:site-specific DNA-methyltransferase (adenine-specific)
MSNIILPDQGLMRLEEARLALAQARTALSECKTVLEAKVIRDQAEAIQRYLKQQRMSQEAQQDAVELKLWAEWRIGDLLRSTPKHNGDPSRQDVRRVSELGIHPRAASRYQVQSLIPEKDRQHYITHTRESGKDLTSADVYRLGSRIARQQRQRERNLAPSRNGHADNGSAGDAEGTAAEPDGKSSGRIIHGDCLSVLPKVRNADLIIADPPYNIGVDYGNGAKADQLSPERYLQWAADWIALCRESLARDGSLWVLIGDEYAAEYGVTLKGLGFTIRAWIKWYETFGVCNSAKTNFSRTSRHLFYCVKNPKRFTFNAEAVSRPSDRKAKYNDKRADPEGKVWDDVWLIPRLTGTSKERIPDFPTQLPLGLVRPIVGCCSNPADLVVDPFCGSATAGVAALELGRRFLGIELNPEFARLGRQRLKALVNGNGSKI